MASVFGQTTTAAGRVSTAQSGKNDVAKLAIVDFVFTEASDLIDATPANDKAFSEIKNDSDYAEKDGTTYGAIRYRLPEDSDVPSEGLPVAYPEDRYNFTLPVKFETVYVETINGRAFYRPVGFQNTVGFNTNMNVLITTIKTTNESTGDKGTTTYSEVSKTGISNSNTSSEEKAKTKNGFQGKYFKRNLKLHQLKPNEGDTVIQSKFGSSIRFSGYLHDDKTNGIQYPSILIRNGENNDSQQNNKVFETTIEDINKDGSSVQITSGEYKTLFKETINVTKEAIQAYPSSDDLKGDQLIANSGRVIISAKTSELFLFSKKNLSIFTDDVVTIDTEKGFNVVSQNGNIQLAAKGSNNITLAVENGKIFAGQNGATEQMVLGNVMVDLLSQLIDAIDQMQFATPSGPSAPGPMDKSPFTDIQNQLKTALSKTNYLI